MRIAFFLSMIAIFLAGALAMRSASAAGVWTPLANQAPGEVIRMQLLTDGTVMAQSDGATWYRLTPDIHGSYTNGTWSIIAPMHDTRLYYSSQVLKDGRVFVAGGEYGSGGSTAEIYDPVTNSWTLTPPAGLRFSDSISETLPNGNILVAPVNPATANGTLIYDVAGNSWSAGPSGFRNMNEVPWVKLPDNSILVPDTDNHSSERYIPSLNQWVNDATIPVAMYTMFETGSGYLLPNGKVFFLGYSHTAIYTPSGTNSPGSWVAGPDIPNGLNCGDSPGAMMVNGVILCLAGTDYLDGVTSYFEYDPVANAFTQVSGPTSLTVNSATFTKTMLCLPDGSVLYADYDTQLYQYTPSDVPLLAGKPTITNVTQNGNGSYHLTGLLLNGISEGAAYGDDWQMNTNFPIVRLTDASNNVYFGRTYNWSSLGVMTGATPQSTDFSLPLNIPAGTYSVDVSANGNASDTVLLTIPVPINDAAPTVATAANATPMNVTGTMTHLTVLGADSDGGGEPNLTYTWAATVLPDGASTPSYSVNGTNGAKSTIATFQHPGMYTFAVTITDVSGLSTSSTVNTMVTAGAALVGAGPDSDGDGFSDAFETTFGFDIYNAFQSPGGGIVTQNSIVPLTISSAKIMLNFARSGKDTITYAGTVPIPAGFDPKDLAVYFDIGNVAVTEMLNTRGLSTNIKLTYKSKRGVVAAQTGKYSITLKFGDFAATLASSGLTNSDSQKVPVNVRFTFILGSTVLQKTQMMSYTSKLNKTGTAKL